MKNIKKRGQSQIISVTLIILISIMIIVIVANLMIGMVRQESKKINIDSFKLNGNLEYSLEKNTQNILSTAIFKVKRGTGEGEIKGVAITCYKDGTAYTYKNTENIPKVLETKIYTVDLTKDDNFIGGIAPGSFDKNTKCEMRFIYNIDNEEKYTRILDEETGTNIIKEPSTQNNGLISYYKFENNAYDEQKNYDGVLEGNAEIVDDAEKGNVLSLLNPGDYISFGDINEIDEANELTLMTWMKLDSGSLNKDVDIFTKGTHSGNQPLLIWRDDSSTSGEQSGNTNCLSGFIDDGPDVSWISSPSNSLNDVNWHHIAVSFKSGESDGLKLYIDGVLKQTGDTTNVDGLENSNNDLRMGSISNYAGALFDDARVYNKALTNNEIIDIYNAEKPSQQQEICNDGTDNDNDGDIDCEDTDCQNNPECQTTQEGLVSYWKFENNAKDEQGENNGILSSGTEKYVQGVVGNAIELNQNNHIDFQDENTLESKEHFTFIAWVYPDSLSSGTLNRDIELNFGGKGQIQFYNQQSGNDKICYYQSINGDYYAVMDCTENPVTHDEWHFVAMSVNYDSGTDYTNVKYYFDGTKIYEVSMNGAPDSSPLDKNLGNDNFIGKLDEVRFYNKALTNQEIIDIYNAEKPSQQQEICNDGTDNDNDGDIDLNDEDCIPQTGLVAYWDFDDDFKDKKINNDCNPIGNPTRVSGDFGKVVEFNGIDQYLDCGNSDFNIDNTNKFTISLLVDREGAGTGTYQPMISKGRYNHPFKIDSYTIGKEIRYGVRVDNSVKYYNTNSDPLQENIWRNIVLTYDGTKASAYLDGQKLSDFSSSGDLTEYAQKLFIGGDDNNNLFNGKIDEVRIYDRVLTNQEINKIYTTYNT